VFLLEENEAVEAYHQASLYGYQELVDYYPGRRKFECNQEILAHQYADRVSITTLANQYGLTPQRVYQIIHPE
jgi:hypothetical protein